MLQKQHKILLRISTFTPTRHLQPLHLPGAGVAGGWAATLGSASIPCQSVGAPAPPDFPPGHCKELNNSRRKPTGPGGETVSFLPRCRQASHPLFSKPGGQSNPFRDFTVRSGRHRKTDRHPDRHPDTMTPAVASPHIPKLSQAT